MIRDVKHEDIEEITSIYNHYISNSVVTFEESEISSSAIEERVLKVKDSGNHWIVALENHTVVGYAYSAKWNNRAAYSKTVEVSVYLSNSYFKKGVGTKLYKELFRRLQENQMHVVIGGITLPNPASVALHEKFGMVKVAHFSEVGFKFGKWLDVGYWQVKLNA